MTRCPLEADVKRMLLVTELARRDRLLHIDIENPVVEPRNQAVDDRNHRNSVG